MPGTGVPEDAQKQVQLLREWIDKQPHLPKDLEDKFLLRFLHSCYYNMEKTKTTMELFFSVRASAPELLTERDPLLPHMQKIMQIVRSVQYEMPGSRNLWIWQLDDPGLENYDYTLDAKLFMLMADVWFLTNEEYVEEDYIIMDVRCVTLKMLTKLNLSVARKLSKYQQDAMPLRLKQIHIVNAPPFIDKVFSLLKPLLRQEITDMIHFHSPNSDSLYEYFKKEELPTDLGGYLPSVEEHAKKTVRVIMDQRSRVLDENFWKVEKKAKNSKEVGTFRSLDID